MRNRPNNLRSNQHKFSYFAKCGFHLFDVRRNFVSFRRKINAVHRIENVQAQIEYKKNFLDSLSLRDICGENFFEDLKAVFAFFDQDLIVLKNESKTHPTVSQVSIANTVCHEKTAKKQKHKKYAETRKQIYVNYSNKNSKLFTKEGAIARQR